MGKKPQPEEQRHHEMLERFGRLMRELAGCVVVKQHPQA